MQKLTAPTIRKSVVPITASRDGGVDIEYGDPIIYEVNGELFEGSCLGWRIEKLNTEAEHYVIKIDCLHPSALPLQKVWRQYDAKDDYIQKLQDQIAPLKSGSRSRQRKRTKLLEQLLDQARLGPEDIVDGMYLDAIQNIIEQLDAL